MADESRIKDLKSEHADKTYDLVVFGASGFTGQYVVEELARTVDEEKGVKWAVAGREMKKLQEVLSTASKFTARDLSEVPILIGDVESETSLLSVCKKTKILLNCVGPYRFYGDKVIKACIESGTHHIDISGEAEWLEKMQLVLDSKAKEANVYLLQACGFESAIAEMGMLYTSKQFKGDLNSVESYVNIKGGEHGLTFNTGTWVSAIHSVKNRSELKSIRQQLFQNPLPKSKHELTRRPPIFYSDDVNSWCLLLLGTDKSIVKRSPCYNFVEKKSKPIQFIPYAMVSGYLQMIVMILFGLVFLVFTTFKFGIYLLETFPGIVSFGSISSKGPTRQQVEGASFDMTFVGQGYSEPHAEEEDPSKYKPDKRIVIRIRGPEAAYITAPICMVQAAYVLLKEMDNLPKGGGVYTPGSAFPETTYLERLDKHNLKFSVVESV